MPNRNEWELQSGNSYEPHPRDGLHFSTATGKSVDGHENRASPRVRVFVFERFRTLANQT